MLNSTDSKVSEETCHTYKNKWIILLVAFLYTRDDKWMMEDESWWIVLSNLQRIALIRNQAIIYHNIITICYN